MPGRLAYTAVIAVVFAVAALGAPALGLAAEPPNQDDPCSTAGRDTCGTLGVGLHKEYRYGIRWFGDFRGAVAGEDHTFCIDLRYWYASPDYKYREQPPSVLHNTDGEVVPVDNRQKLAYAAWTYGRTSDPHEQATVALYVHSLMGDARPGEVDAAAVSPAAAALSARIARNAARYHGPYKLDVHFSDALTVGEQGRATIRLLADSGAALPDVSLNLKATGATGVPRQVQTNGEGVASVRLTPTAAGTVRLATVTEPVASTLPRIFRATTAAAAPNAQRLAAPDSQRVTATSTAPVRSQIQVKTQATPTELAVGEESTDEITISGALPGWHASVTAQIFGPFESAEAIRCEGAPIWHDTFTVSEAGVVTTDPAILTKVGWYSYREIVPGDAQNVGVTTPCAVPSEVFQVLAQPTVSTVISSQTAQPGAAIYDRVNVAGLAGQSATVQAALYGPFTTRDAINCDGTPVWSGSIAVQEDGEYKTEPFTVSAAGFYTYKEWIMAAGFVRAATTECGDAAETTLVQAKPAVITSTSAPGVVRSGTTITDKFTVTQLGGRTGQVKVNLYGPFPSKATIRCKGRPHSTQMVNATDNQPVTTPGVKVTDAGFYTYREQIIATPVIKGATTGCALARKTSLVAPVIATGRGDDTRRPALRQAAQPAPKRIRLPSLGIDAPVRPAGIDVRSGVLAIPDDIAKTGWWRDGMAPGATAGAILIAGHVDSAKAGEGAFFALRRVSPGDVIQITSADGRTFAYRAISVRNYRRAALPLSVFARDGAPRLVLVTCGGPFDVKTGHYRDNVVVTAVPARD